MRWSGEQYVLLLTAVLFAVVPLLGSRPSFRLARMSAVVFGGAAVVTATSAFLLATVEHPSLPALLWWLPAIPVVVIVIMVRDAASRRRSQAPHVSQPVTAGSVSPPLRVQVPMPSTAPLASHHPADDATARARAHNPYTDAADLADLAYGYPALRAAVARNPAAPAAVLEWLAEIGDPVVTAAITARGSSPRTRSGRGPADVG